MDSNEWKVCSTCKKPIGFGEKYWVCSVSTCNRKNTGYVFCSVSCWDSHVPMMRHRNAWAEERRAPSRKEWLKTQEEERHAEQSKRHHDEIDQKRSEGIVARLLQTKNSAPKEILIVASRLKRYIKERSGLKTSDEVMEILSDRVREAADQAIRNAAQTGRSTVLKRDVPKTSSSERE